MEVDRVVCAVATALRNLAIDQRNKELIGEEYLGHSLGLQRFFSLEMRRSQPHLGCAYLFVKH